MSVGKMYHKLDFSALEDEILFEKVRENPPLYAKKLKSYKDIKMKDNIGAKIAKEMGESGYNRTGEECKKRWTNLRDYYVRKKKGSSTGSAASSQGNEKFDQMKFLDSTAFEHRTTKSNVSTAAVADGQVSDDNKRVGHDSDMESRNEETENQSIIGEISIEENEEINETQEITATATQVSEVDKANGKPIEKIAATKRGTQSETRGRIDAKKARMQLYQDKDKGRSERMTLLRGIAQRATTSMPQSIEDPVDLFFKSLAATAKTLSLRYLVETKRKLFLVMAEIEEKNIAEKYPSSNPFPSPGCLSSNPSPSPGCLSSNPSPFPAFVSPPNQSPSLQSSDDPPNPSPSPAFVSPLNQSLSLQSSDDPTNEEPNMPSDFTLHSYLATYTPL